MDSLQINFVSRKDKDGLLYLYLRINLNSIRRDSALAPPFKIS